MSRDRSDAIDIGLRLWGVAVLLFLFLPIAVIVIYSINTGRVLSTWEGAGLDSYRQALTNPTLVETVLTSIKAAIGSSIVAVVVGTAAGMSLARRPGKTSRALVAVILLVLVTPEIVAAISMLIWFVRLGGIFDDGLIRLFVSHSIVGAAVVALIVRARMSALDPALEQASNDLYAGPLRTFRSITLPLMMPAVLSGGLLAFSLSLDNTVISAFVSVAGSSPFPVYVLSAVRATLRPEIAAMAALMLALTLIALAAVFLVLRRATGESSEAAKGLTGLA